MFSVKARATPIALYKGLVASRSQPNRHPERIGGARVGQESHNGLRMTTEASVPRRKLSAIVMVDVSGFSRMMGRNEERATTRIRKFHARTQGLVESHEGRVVDTARPRRQAGLWWSEASVSSPQMRDGGRSFKRRVCFAQKPTSRIPVTIGHVS